MSGEERIGLPGCRYPCGCDQFDDEHCSCMDGHTPVPSEATEAGEGERDECRCPPDHAMGFTVHQPPCRFAPAEPDAGEVELLRDVLSASEGGGNWHAYASLTGIAEDILASPWLAALLDRERRAGKAEGLREAERLIEAADVHRCDTWTIVHRAVRDRADRIEATP